MSFRAWAFCHTTVLMHPWNEGKNVGKHLGLSWMTMTIVHIQYLFYFLVILFRCYASTSSVTGSLVVIKGCLACGSGFRHRPRLRNSICQLSVTVNIGMFPS